MINLENLILGLLSGIGLIIVTLLTIELYFYLKKKKNIQGENNGN